MRNWDKLDVVATLYKAIEGNKNSAVFRVGVILAEEVNPKLLQDCILIIYNRFPMMFPIIKKGFFWNYYERNINKFDIKVEEDYPCKNMIPVENDNYLIRVLYHKNRISVEIFHALTDASGAIEFLKTLLYTYLTKLHGEFDHQNKILLVNEPVAKNMHDDFIAYFSKAQSGRSSTKRIKEQKAFQIKGETFKQGGNNIVTGIINSDRLNQVAKSYNATITAYLSGLLNYCIYHSQKKYSNCNKNIVVALPVNLRKMFPSQTLRNFVSVINVAHSPTNNTLLREIVDDVTQQMKNQLTVESLSYVCCSHVEYLQKVYLRPVPLFIKESVISSTQNRDGENKKTITLSNVGIVDIPDEMKKHIIHMESILYPTVKSPISCAIITFNGCTAISFTRSIVESDIIRLFFKHLSDQENLDIKIYSNDLGVINEKMQ